jgi:hypothetical protein
LRAAHSCAFQPFTKRVAEVVQLTGRSANILKGVVHLVVFAAYLFLSIVP